ncbi:hypothetical protein M527_01820 [Sphingobium indicum IP26]|nr:hypothetical protein M527_01820 [Sphingobium indicum IP26]
MPAVQRILRRYARHDRETLEAFLSVAIELLDTLDGDTDREDENDLEPDDDAKGDVSWPEWHTLSAAMRRSGNNAARDQDGFMIAEDAEDDDPAEDSDSDEDEGDREQVHC